MSQDIRRQFEDAVRLEATRLTPEAQEGLSLMLKHLEHYARAAGKQAMGRNRYLLQGHWNFVATYAKRFRSLLAK